MRISKFGNISVVLIFFSFPLFAQTLQPSSQENNINVKQIKKTDPGTEKLSQKQNPPIQRLSFFKQKLNKEQQKQIQPETEDLLLYSAFLQQPKTGLIRLIDDIGCSSNALVLRADEECLKTVSGASFYSFREREYSSSALADVRLKDGLLISDGILSQNIIVKLGNIPLESVSPNNEGMKFLMDFLPESDVKEATDQYIKLTRGIKVGKFEYLKVLPASINTTYAMRLIAYKGKILRPYRGFVYNLLSGDNRSDLLLAFRIIRKENDGITIVWKELERKKSPKITYSKRGK